MWSEGAAAIDQETAGKQSPRSELSSRLPHTSPPPSPIVDGKDGCRNLVMLFNQLRSKGSRMLVLNYLSDTATPRTSAWIEVRLRSSLTRERGGKLKGTKLQKLRR